MLVPRFRLLLLLSMVLILTVGTAGFSGDERSTLAARLPAENRLPISSFPALASQADSLPVVEMVGGIGGRSSSITVVGTSLYMIEGNKLSILDVRDPAHSVMRGRVGLPSPDMTYSPIMPIQVSGNLVYVVNQVGLHIVDVSDPAHPALQGSFAIQGITEIQVSGNLVYVINQIGLHIVDVSDPAHPALQGSFPYSLQVICR